MGFKISWSMAIQQACKKATPGIMEPMMSVEVVVPEEYLGDVMGDINSRRGNIWNMGQRKDAHTLDAVVPLSRMFGYATDLRSATQGRATFTMEPLKYSEVPKTLAEAITNKNE